MSARSHAGRGQLFGHDGQTMWIEQTLDTTPPEPRKACGCLPDEDCPECRR